MNTLTHTPLHLNTASFATALETSHDRPVLVDFWAPWCGPCKAQGPILEKLAAEQGERAVVAKVDTDEAPELAEAHLVRALPTLIVFRNGREHTRLVGLQSAEALANALDAAR